MMTMNFSLTKRILYGIVCSLAVFVVPVWGNTCSSNKGVFEALHVEYEEMASWYDAFWGSYLDQTLKKPLDLVLEAIMSEDSRTPLVVDVACGTGEFLHRLQQAAALKAQKPFRLVGVEPSGAMLDQAHAKHGKTHEDSPTPKKDVVEFHQATAENVPLNKESAHVVCSTNAFHFFRDKPKALSELKRILKRGGKLVITDWCSDFWMVRMYHAMERIRWWRFSHRYPGPLTTRAMKELLEAAGFDDVQVKRYILLVWGIVPWGMQTATATRPTS